MAVVWCPTDKMTKDFLTKLNQGSIFKRFRDLVMGIMPQTDPNNVNRTPEIKSRLRKLINNKIRSGRHDKYHKLPQECVADRLTDGGQNRIRIKTGKTVFESQKTVSQISIQRGME